MQNLLSLSLLLILITFTQLKGQDTINEWPKENLTRRISNDGLILGKTIIETYKRPLKWKKKQWLITGGVLAFSAAVSLLDEPIYDYYSIRKDTDPFISAVADIGDFMGQPEHNYPFMISMWGLGVITKSEWMRDTGILLFASITTSGLVQTALKDVVGRARPDTGKGPYSFRPFGGRAYHSFPSGHTMLALASAYVLAHQIDFMPLRVAVFAIPVITGFSRIHDGAHFVSDIVLGSAIGIAFAEAVLTLYPMIKAEQRSRISLLPSGSGFRLAYHF